MGTLDRYGVDNVLNYMTPGARTIDGFNLARDSKRRRGGGTIFIPAGDYYLEDELVLVDFVKFEGESDRITRLFGSPNVNGEGRAVVRSCSIPITSKDLPEPLSHTGISNCTINGSNTWDCCLYVRLTTNESRFNNVTTQSAKLVNTNIIYSWYVSMNNHASRDAMNYGIIIGRAIFNESGSEEVNACSFLNMRSNYSGQNDKYHPTNNPFAGAGITIWIANSCAFDYLGAENSYGVGILARKGINSTLGDIYTEANGKGSKATEKIGLYVINADSAPLLINYLNLTSEQKVFLDLNSLLSLGYIYRHSFESGCFLGGGEVFLRNPRNANLLSNNDLAYVSNIKSLTLCSFANVSMTSYTALDSLVFYNALERISVSFIFNPRVTFSHTDSIIIRILVDGNNIDINFGQSFTKDIQVTKKVIIPKGVVHFKQQSNSLPDTSTGASADMFLEYYHIDGFPIYNY
ncbi:hypothetical protein [Xenorhabdus ishibashii]|uniref:Pectate lyase superfamily protein domain-containing protein n=1 Tax=Xenorhabdus ishibashii TaxID=1034471 RepID=A0A2D0KEF9_9GAMM|nr:hypothetical protein [Xenorhabdus ishibashii]PHM61811.1 hypothetical protein Xish_00959 [Xenorhabdus ishibashii]